MPDNSFLRDASGRLTFEMMRVACTEYRRICDALSTTFKLTRVGSVVDGWDVVFQDYRQGELVIGLEWDNWSGFIVVAKEPNSELLVREIAEWLQRSEWAN